MVHDHIGRVELMPEAPGEIGIKFYYFQKIGRFEALNDGFGNNTGTGSEFEYPQRGGSGGIAEFEAKGYFIGKITGTRCYGAGTSNMSYEVDKIQQNLRKIGFCWLFMAVANQNK